MCVKIISNVVKLKKKKSLRVLGPMKGQEKIKKDQLMLRERKEGTKGEFSGKSAVLVWR